MEQRKVNLYYGALFHDIGKAVMRVDNRRIKHQRVGSEFLKRIFDVPEILNSLLYHHADDDKLRRPAGFPDDDLSYITYIADNIASGTDRRKHGEKVDRKWNAHTSLQDVFNRFGQESTKSYLKPSALKIDDPDSAMPTNTSREYAKGDYGREVEYFRTGLMAIKPTEEYMQSALNLLEAAMSTMPSSTNMEEVADISLYDHMKLTAAFALAIQQYLDFMQETNYRKVLYTGSQKFYKENAFMMVKYEFLGLEKFIYTIVSQGAHKQLRSRAFYAEMLGEWFVDTLLSDAELTRANVIYTANGQGYIIMGNTPKNRRILENLRQEFNDFLQSYFGTQLYVITGTAKFSANQVRDDNTFESYSAIYQEIDAKLQKMKNERYSATEILALNQQGKSRGRECVVCHTVDDLIEGENKCRLCAKLENFSKNIQKEDFFVVNGDQTGLPIGPGAYLSITNEEAIRKNEITGKIYSKNQLNTGFKQQTYLWVADYSYLENNDFNSYAERKWLADGEGRTLGIKRLAALKVDVDDLYAGFLAGFADQDNGKYTTISRYATLSRRISSFFRVYLNTFADSYALTVVSSGGDEVFLIGAWDDVIAFLADLRDYFKAWTQGKMTFSAGIYMYQAKQPINIVNRQTNYLLQLAKQAGKDRITLFDETNIFKLDDFINDIYYDKLQVIKRFFMEEDSYGKAFIYKLLDLIRTRNEVDKISFARLVYFLSRLETRAKNKDNFKQFKEAIIDWFEDAKEIKAVETALTLYLYEIREED